MLEHVTPTPAFPKVAWSAVVLASKSTAFARNPYRTRQYQRAKKYRRYNIVDMEVLKTATNKIQEHHREIVEAENSHKTAIVRTETGADDKGKPIN